MSTEMVLLEAEIALKSVQENEFGVLIGVLLLAAGIVIWMLYVLDRWSWIPRKRSRRSFREVF